MWIVRKPRASAIAKTQINAILITERSNGNLPVCKKRRRKDNEHIHNDRHIAHTIRVPCLVRHANPGHEHQHDSSLLYITTPQHKQQDKLKKKQTDQYG